MAEPSLKIVAEAPPAADAKSDAIKSPRRKFSRKRLRTILLIVVPVGAVAIGAFIYLGSGRCISTDNAYVGSQKVLITPDISGKVDRVMVREGQHVKSGDELFEIDRQPFRSPLTQAQAKVDSPHADYSNLTVNLESLTRLVELSKQAVDLKQRDVDRKSQLA